MSSDIAWRSFDEALANLADPKLEDVVRGAEDFARSILPMPADGRPGCVFTEVARKLLVLVITVLKMEGCSNLCLDTVLDAVSDEDAIVAVCHRAAAESRYVEVFGGFPDLCIRTIAERRKVFWHYQAYAVKALQSEPVKGKLFIF